MPTFGTYGNCSHDDRMGKMHLAIDNETLNRSLSTRLIAKNGTDNLMVGRRYNYNYNIAQAKHRDSYFVAGQQCHSIAYTSRAFYLVRLPCIPSNFWFV